MARCPECLSTAIDSVPQALPMREYRAGDELVPIRVWRECRCLNCGNEWSQAGTAPVDPPNTTMTGGPWVMR
ncbi:MAG: hypothetical protein ACK4TP_10235 [Hyphomicrobium sp.]